MPATKRKALEVRPGAWEEVNTHCSLGGRVLGEPSILYARRQNNQSNATILAGSRIAATTIIH